MGSLPTRAPNAGGVGKTEFFHRSTAVQLVRLTDENFCQSAMVVCIHDGELVEEDAMSSTTLVIVAPL